MLDSIRTLTDLPDPGEVHLCREDIAAARRRRALQLQAQAWARECVDQARRDSEAIHAQAFQEGYAEGVLRVTEHLAESLLASRALAVQLRNDVAQAAGDLLAQALSRPEWLDDMLERWLAEQAHDASAVLYLLLPEHWRSRSHELRERLHRLWPGELVFEFVAQERYVLRLGDQLLEFDIAAAREKLEPRLLACVNNLPASVRSLDRKSKRALTDLCASFAGVPDED
ncbi:oxygen-regulated invasion protein OrgB [Pseudomonas sp. SDO55104_S430]